MKKKNGYALILSLVVISLLLVLCTTVLSLSTLAYKGTKKFEETNNLKLVAESGIEKGKTVLKNYLLINTNRTNGGESAFDYLSFNPDNINNEFGNQVLGTDLCYMVGDIKCTITFSPDDPSALFHDVSTGRNISYIEIQAKAEKGLASKTFSVILDKTAISNVYFAQIFNSSITVADNITNSVYESANIRDASIIKLSGNVYLQGSLINLFPNSIPNENGFTYNEGKIVVNSNVLKTTINKDFLGGSVDLFKNTGSDITGNGGSFSGWQDATIKKLKVLPILDGVPGTEIEPLLDLANGSNLTDIELKKYALFKDQIDPFKKEPIILNGVQPPPTLVTFKVTRSDGNPISFKQIIDGSDYSGGKPGIYKSIIETLVQRAKDNNIDPATPLSDKAANDIAEANYGEFYKLILVKGDLIIEDNDKENFVNYLIYCTGKVTIQGEAHLYNSSIFAKKLEINSNGKLVELYGVNTVAASAYTIGNKHLSDFSNIDKMIINSYLINNLDGYADSLSYKIIQWK